MKSLYLNAFPLVNIESPAAFLLCLDRCTIFYRVALSCDSFAISCGERQWRIRHEFVLTTNNKLGLGFSNLPLFYLSLQCGGRNATPLESATSVQCRTAALFLKQQINRVYMLSTLASVGVPQRRLSVTGFDWLIHVGFRTIPQFVGVLVPNLKQSWSMDEGYFGLAANFSA